MKTSKIIAAVIVAASIAPVHAETGITGVRVKTTKGARVTISYGKKKQTKTAKSGNVLFKTSARKVKVIISKKGYVTWHETYGGGYDTHTTFRAFDGVETEDNGNGKFTVFNECVNAKLIRAGKKRVLAGNCGDMSFLPKKAFNCTLKATDGKHVYRTKLKNGKFSFGKVVSGYYKISGKSIYKGRTYNYSCEKSAPSSSTKLAVLSSSWQYN